MNCSVEHCNEPIRSKGFCAAHYRRNRKYGDPTVYVGKGGNNKTHGMSRSRTYTSWVSMNRRCYKENEINYKYYGGRGITVCEQWRHDFAQFLADLGERPANTSLDRIDHNGNYEPGNVRWGTRHEQAANTRTTSKNVGVSFDKYMGLWTAKLMINGEEMLPYSWYSTQEQAMEARRQAMLKYLPKTNLP